MVQVRSYERAALVVFVLWLLFCLATVGYNGPSPDEAWSITNGLLILQGHGPAGPLNGSLLWPLAAAAGYRAGGLAGARLVALGMVGVALAATVRATQNLFGATAAFWAAVALVVNGFLLALSRQAIPEAPAAAGVAVSLMALTELARRNHRGWLLVAAGAFVFAATSAYAVALVAPPLLGVLFSLRPRRAGLDSAIAGITLLAVSCALLPLLHVHVGQSVLAMLPALPDPEQPAALAAWFVRLYALSGLLPLGVAGWYAARERRRLAAALLLSLLLWPLYHALTGSSAGEQAHTALGLLFASPVIGLALATLWAHAVGRPFAVAAGLGLLLLGFVQAGQLQRSWADVREAAGYLAQVVQPGDKLLIDNPWPFAIYLYTQGRIGSPLDVYDTGRLFRGGSSIVTLCEYDWVVSVEGTGPWPEEITAAIMDCEAYAPAYAASSTVIRLGPDLRYGAYPVRIIVWRNPAGR